MPKIKKELDALTSSSLKRVNYENMAIRNSKKVPEEYRTLKKAKNRGNGCLLFLFILFLAAAAGFYYFSSQQKPQVKNSLELKIENPSEIISGDQVTYLIKYKNLDDVALQKMELSVKWPNGFYYDESSQAPRDDSATIWDLPDLAVGGEATLEIKGQLVGNVDEILKGSFVMQYQPVNFNSDFNSKLEVETRIKESKLSLLLEGVEKTMVGTEQEYKIKCKNLTTEELPGLLDILYPDDFTVASVDPKKDGDYWTLDLKAEEEKTITIKGSFDKDSTATQLLVVELGNKVNDKFRRMARAEKNIAVINPSFSVKLQVNNKFENQTVNWGDTLNYQLEVTNNSESDLSDIKISSLLDGQVLDWASLNITDNSGQLDNNTIIWDKQKNQDLALWPKGVTKNFSWNVKVLSKPVSERMLDNVVKINIEGLDNWEQVQPALVLTVGENIKFNAGVYWELTGRRVGSGVIPPKVGAETQYLVVWSLVETTGKFNSIIAESDLPPGVEYVSLTDVQEGSLSFDEATRTLSWEISDMKNIILPTIVSFMIKIEPKLADQGQALTLLNPITVTAKGLEEVVMRSKLINTSDVVADSTQSVGIVQ
jgi:uncharacterized repeat protein (TIGR01451 family)